MTQFYNYLKLIFELQNFGLQNYNFQVLDNKIVCGFSPQEQCVFLSSP